MSTRSVIAVETEDGYEAIYCHQNGQDDGVGVGVGPTLREHYGLLEDAEKLIALGSIAHVKPKDVYAYHRDRGDDWDQTRPKRFYQFEDLLKHAIELDAEYLYVLEDWDWIATKI